MADQKKTLFLLGLKDVSQLRNLHKKVEKTPMFRPTQGLEFERLEKK